MSADFAMFGQWNLLFLSHYLPSYVRFLQSLSFEHVTSLKGRRDLAPQVQLSHMSSIWSWLQARPCLAYITSGSARGCRGKVRVFGTVSRLLHFPLDRRLDQIFAKSAYSGFISRLLTNPRLFFMFWVTWELERKFAFRLSAFNMCKGGC